MGRTGRWTVRGTIPLAGLVVLLVAACGPPPARGPELEHVQVGYGAMEARDLTGAVSSISGSQLHAHRAGRVEELFQGRLAGVTVTRTPGGGYSVRIRGASNLMGNGDPLFVIDGVPLHSARPGHELDGINPADIERIDVLKDAGSAAIYGSRGANGVILITTRRP